MAERERGPVEQRLHDLIRHKAGGTPWLLNAQIERRDSLDPIEHINQLHVMTLTLMEALLALAHEVDDLRAGR